MYSCIWQNAFKKIIIFRTLTKLDLIFMTTTHVLVESTT